MNQFKTFVKRMIPKVIQKPVGRWRLENCSEMLNQKVDLSNEDHCGSCGLYALQKLDFQKSENSENSGKSGNSGKSEKSLEESREKLKAINK